MHMRDTLQTLSLLRSLSALGVEKQYRLKCGSCHVPVCYQTKDFTTDVKDIEYLYIMGE